MSPNLGAINDMSKDQLVEFLKQFDSAEQKEVIYDLLKSGEDPQKVLEATRELAVQHSDRTKKNLSILWWTLAAGSGALSAFHGYRRSNSIPKALGWFMAGTILPIPTVVIAIAQGYAKPKRDKDKSILSRPRLRRR